MAKIIFQSIKTGGFMSLFLVLFSGLLILLQKFWLATNTTLIKIAISILMSVTVWDRVVQIF
jgi:hypothetical protein